MKSSSSLFTFLSSKNIFVLALIFLAMPLGWGQFYNINNDIGALNQAQADGNTIAHFIEEDPVGAFYVSGTFDLSDPHIAHSFDENLQEVPDGYRKGIYVSRYNSDNEVLWSRYILSVDESADMHITGMELVADEQVILTGYSNGQVKSEVSDYAPIENEYFSIVAMFDRNGNPTQCSYLRPLDKNSTIFINDITVTSNGFAVVGNYVGEVSVDLQGGDAEKPKDFGKTSGFVSFYNFSFDLLNWGEVVNNSSGISSSDVISFNQKTNEYVMGISSISADESDYYLFTKEGQDVGATVNFNADAYNTCLVTFAFDGNILPVTYNKSNNSSSNFNVVDLEISESGEIYLLGNFSGEYNYGGGVTNNIASSTSYVACLESDLTLKTFWYNTAPSVIEYPNDLEIVENDKLVVLCGGTGYQRGFCHYLDNELNHINSFNHDNAGLYGVGEWDKGGFRMVGTSRDGVDFDLTNQTNQFKLFGGINNSVLNHYEDLCQIYEPNGRIYVNEAAALGGNGSSWGSAFRTIDEAIERSQLCSNVDEIWVASGNYEATGLSINNTSSLSVFGGFSGDETSLIERNFNLNETYVTSSGTGSYYSFYGSSPTTIRFDGFFFRSENSNTAFAIYYQNNEIYNCKFDGFGKILDGALEDTESANFVNNLVLNSTGGTSIYGIPGSGAFTVNIYNNTFSYSTSTATDVFWVYDTDIVSPSILSVRNNVFYKINTFENIAAIDVNLEFENNIWYSDNGCPNGCAGSGNVEGEDPLFTDGDNGDFSLQVSSPAIDAGVDNTYVPDYDLGGSNRVNGDRIDIGAYEGLSCPTNTIVYVDNSLSSNGDGESWATAYNNLPEANLIANSCPVVKELWIAEGTYLVPSENGYAIADGIRYYGGFANGASSISDQDTSLHKTIITGDFNADDTPDFGNHSDNSFHVFTGINLTSTSTLLSGLFITGGNAADYGQTDGTYGGGVYVSSGSITISKCNFYLNRADNSGGALYLEGASSTSLSRVELSKFHNNSVGGGGNSSWYGGAIFGSTGRFNIASSDFESNSSSDYGGAIFLEGGSSLEFANITDSRFISNTSVNNGGAVVLRGYNDDVSSIGTISNCEFYQNVAFNDGGAYYSFSNYDSYVLSSIFSGNHANRNGGAICGIETQDLTSQYKISNCIFHENNADGSGTALRLNSSNGVMPNTGIHNSIFFENGTGNVIDDNQAGDVPVSNSLLVLTGSNDIKDDGGNVFTGDPMFVDPLGTDGLKSTGDEDYSLSCGSAAIGIGLGFEDGYFNMPETDPFDIPYGDDGELDAGVFEYDNSQFSTVVTTTADDGSCGTLRYITANASSGDVITFAPSIFGETIILDESLGSITFGDGNIHILGDGNPDSSIAVDGYPDIAITGSGDFDQPLISITTGNNVIQGLNLQNVPLGDNNDALLYLGGSFNLVFSCFIGTDLLGENSASGGSTSTPGVRMDASSDENQIGGGADSTNVISGNTGPGILIFNTDNHKIYGNIIGLNREANAILANSGAGITIQSGDANTIGSYNDSRGNIIAGNASSGIRIFGAGGNTALGNEIKGNYIGTNSDQTFTPGNNGYGVLLQDLATNTIIGGYGDANIIRSHGAGGIHVNGAGSVNNNFHLNRNFNNQTVAIQISAGQNGILKPVLSNIESDLSISGEAGVGTYDPTTDSVYLFTDLANQGQKFVAATNINNDATGTFTFNLTSDDTTNFYLYDSLTVIAYAGGNTSEFSDPVTNIIEVPRPERICAYSKSNYFVDIHWSRIAGHTSSTMYNLFYTSDTLSVSATAVTTALGDTSAVDIDLSGLADQIVYFGVSSGNSDTSYYEAVVPVIEAGQALTFDGSTSGASATRVETELTNVGGNTFTAMAWVKMNSYPTGFSQIFSKWSPGWINSDFSSGYRSDKDSLYFGVSSGTVNVPGVDIFAPKPKLNEWVHFAVSYDGAVLRLYLNGKLEKSAAYVRDSASFPTVSRFMIGQQEDLAVERGWDGEIDEVALFDNVLDGGTIDLYKDTPLSGQETGLLGLWHFDENTGDIAYDASCNNNHGVLFSSPVFNPSEAMHPFVQQICARATGSTTSDVTWSDTITTDIKEYNVYTSADSSVWLEHPSSPVSSANVTLSGLTTDQLMYVSVEAVDNNDQVGKPAVTAVTPVLEAGGAFTFDGISNTMSVSELAGLPIGSEARSFEAWVKIPEGGTDNAAIFSYGPASSYDRLTMRVRPDGSIYIDVNVGTQYWDADLNDNEWHHVAMTYPEAGTFNDILVYVDGINIPRTSGGSNTILHTLEDEFSIGYVRSNPVDNQQYFYGEMDEFRVWNDVRTAAEINENKDFPLTGAEDGLVALYHFDESQGNQIYDATCRGNDGVNVGATPGPSQSMHPYQDTITTTANGSDIDITWSDNLAVDTDTISVYRRVSSTGDWEIISNGLTANTFTDVVPPSDSLFYYIISYDQNGQPSIPSEVDTVYLCSDPLIVNKTNDDGSCGTLRYAIGYANANGGNTSIRFDPNIANDTIRLDSTLFITAENITIDGESNDVVISSYTDHAFVNNSGVAGKDVWFLITGDNFTYKGIDVSINTDATQVAEYVFYVQSDNATFEDFRSYEQNGESQTIIFEGIGLYVKNASFEKTDGAILPLAGCTDIIIDSCHFGYTPGQPFSGLSTYLIQESSTTSIVSPVNEPYAVQITNSYFSNFGNNGLKITASSYIENCSFGITSDGRLGTVGWNASIFAADEVVFRNNIITSYNSSPSTWTLALGGSGDFVVEDNKIYSRYQGVEVATSATGNFRFARNLIYNVQDSLAIDNQTAPWIPVINEVDVSAGTVSGNMTTGYNTGDYKIELFGDSLGQARLFIDSVYTGADGSWVISGVDFTPFLGDSLNYVTATATHISTQNTSNLSDSMFVCTSPLLVTKATDNKECGDLRYAIEYANDKPGFDTITFDLADNTIVFPMSSLPVLRDSIMINGDMDGDDIPDIALDGNSLVISVALNISGSRNTIKSLALVGFDEGVFISGQYNTVEYSYVGIDLDGSTANGNSNYGILIHESDNNTLQYNTISGNIDDGVSIIDGSDNLILNNIIGLDALGETSVGNISKGISISGGDGLSDNNKIEDNLIGGNTMGVLHDFGNFTSIRNNSIGVNINGSPRPNSTVGIRIEYGVTNDTLDGNIIAFNGTNGIEINTSSQENTIKNNSIYSNTLKGIAIEVGSQNNINTLADFTISLDSVVSGDGAEPSALIQLFADSTGQGQVLLDTTYANVLGVWSKKITDWTRPVGVDSLTATQTDLDGNTSEFSEPILIDFCDPFLVTSAFDGVGAIDQCGTFRHAIRELVLQDGGDTIRFDTTSWGGHTIVLESELQEIQNETTNWGIDGYDYTNNRPGIEITSSISGSYEGIRINGNASHGFIKGLVMNNFQNAIETYGSSHNITISDNYIGTDFSGEALAGNTQDGVSINSDTSFVFNNLASGNRIGITVGAPTVHVYDNVVGLSLSQTQVIPNTANGIHVNTPELIDPVPPKGIIIENNVVSGNGAYGIRNTSTRNVLMIGNIIGLDSSQTKAFPNSRSGILLTQDVVGNQVGGEGDSANVIAYNLLWGIEYVGDINNGSPQQTVVTQNSIYGNEDGAFSTTNHNPVPQNDLQPPFNLQLTSATTLEGRANENNSRIEIYADSSDQAQMYLGYVDAPASSPRDWVFDFTTITPALTLGDLLAIGLDSLTVLEIDPNGNTSVLSLPVTIDISIPAPASLCAQPSNGEVYVSWDVVAEAINGYEVIWTTTATDTLPASGATFSNQIVAGLDTTITGLTNDDLHYFAVVSVGGDTSNWTGAVPVVEAGRAISLDRSNYLTVGSHNFPVLDQARTVEAWINIDNLDNRQSVFAYGATTASNAFKLEITTDGRVRFGSYIVDAYSPADVIEPNEYYHVAISYEEGEDMLDASIYVNGVLVPTVELSAGEAEQPLNTILSEKSYIGFDDIGSPNAFSGKIDEVRLWSTARTATEINEFNDNPLTVVQNGLVGLWHLDETSGTIAYDASCNGNHGTWNGTPATVESGAMQPFAPQSVAANVDCGNAEVEIIWEDTLTSDVASYRIYRSTDLSIDTSSITAFSSATENYLDSDNLIADTKYYYGVAGVDLVGNQGVLSIVDSVVYTTIDTSLTIVGDTILCEGSNVDTLFTASADSIEWYLGGSEVGVDTFYVPTTSGNYYFLKYENGCSASSRIVTITESTSAVVDLGLPIDLCDSETELEITVETLEGVTQGTWTTLGSGTFDDDSQITTNYQPSSVDINSGSFSLVFEADSITGCNNTTDTLDVTVIGTPIISIVTEDEVACTEEVVSLSALTDGTNIEWSSTGDGVFNDINSEINEYEVSSNDLLLDSIVLYIDAVGTQCSASDSMTIYTATGTSTLEIVPVDFSMYCENGDISFDTVTTGATGQTDFAWELVNNGLITSGDMDMAVLNGTDYSPGDSLLVTGDVSNECGLVTVSDTLVLIDTCSQACNVEIILVDEALQVCGTDTSLVDQYTLETNETIRWFLDDTSSTEITDVSGVSASGDYIAMLDSGACTALDTIAVAFGTTPSFSITLSVKDDSQLCSDLVIIDTVTVGDITGATFEFGTIADGAYNFTTEHEISAYHDVNPEAYVGGTINVCGNTIEFGDTLEIVVDTCSAAPSCDLNINLVDEALQVCGTDTSLVDQYTLETNETIRWFLDDTSSTEITDVSGVSASGDYIAMLDSGACTALDTIAVAFGTTPSFSITLSVKDDSQLCSDLVIIDTVTVGDITGATFEFGTIADGAYNFTTEHEISAYNDVNPEAYVVGTINVCGNTIEFGDTLEIVVDTCSLSNEAPVAGDDIAITDEDVSVSIPVLDNDTDADAGDVLSIFSTTDPSNGTVTIESDGTITYLSELNFFGNDSFEYVVDDGNDNYDTAVVSITINSINDAPDVPSGGGRTSESITATENGGTVTSPNLTDNNIDPEGDNVSLSTVPSTSVNGGTVVDNGDGTIDYTPAADFSGEDEVIYEVCDDGSPQACFFDTLIITVDPAGTCDNFEPSTWAIDVPSLNLCNVNTLTASVDNVASYSYQWYWNGQAIQGATQNEYEVFISGAYTVTIGDESCSATTDELDITSTLSSYTITKSGDLLTPSVSGDSYQWYVEVDGVNYSIVNATNFSYEPYYNGLYKVEIKDGACAGIASYTLNVAGFDNVQKQYLFDPGNSFVELVEKGDVTVYPNPSAGVVYLTGLSSNDKTVIVRSATGQVLQTIRSDQHEITLDLSTLPVGVYHLEIIEDTEIFTTKISLQ